MSQGGGREKRDKEERDKREGGRKGGEEKRSSFVATLEY